MRKALLFISLIISPLIAKCQFNWDYGFRLGASNYLGDIGGKQNTRKDFVSDMKLAETKPSGGFYVRYKIINKISVKGSFNYGRIAGADSLSTNKGRRGRNLSFRDDIFELAVQGEFNFYNNYDVGGGIGTGVAMTSYLFAGAAVFHFNPKAYYEGKWYALQPLRTEGEVKPYSRINMSTPLGIGLNFTFERKYRIGWELGWRKTFTDYLDDVSGNYADPSQLPSPLAVALANRSGQYTSDPKYLANYAPGNKRGDPTHNDSYIFTTIDFGIVIRGKSNFYRAHYGSIFNSLKYKRRRHRAKF